MISSRSLKLMPYKQTDAVQNVMENRFYQSSRVYAGVNETFSHYIAEGYSIYDVAAEGGFSNLESKASGKWLCIWKTGEPSGNYDVRGAFIVSHDDVVIMGLQLNEYNQPVKHSLDICFNWAYGNSTGDCDYQYKLTVMYVKASATIRYGSNATIKQVFFKNNYILEDQFAGYNLYESCGFENNYLYVPGYLKIKQLSDSGIDEIKNNYFKGIYASTAGLQIILEKDLKITNTVFKDFYLGSDTCKLNFEGGTNRILNFDNVMIENSLVKIYELSTDDNSVIFIRNTDLFNGKLSNYQFKPAYPERQRFYFGVPAVNTDLINFDDFKEVTANLKVDYVPGQGLLSFGTENYYRVEFCDSEVADELKKGFGDGMLWFTQRQDFESDLIGKHIYRFGFYQDSVHTLPLDFYNDENFFIFAENSSGETAVLCFYNNCLYPTVYGDVSIDESYKITRCFQIWQAETRTGLKNLFKNFETGKGISDGPMEGSVRFNNFDKEVLIRL